MKKKKGIPVNHNSDDLKIPKIDEKAKTGDSRWGGIRAYWLDEKGEKKRTKPKFGLINFSLEKLIDLSYPKNEYSMRVKYDAGKMRFIHRVDGTLDKTL